ncbi:MAG: hypothetical protein JWN04_5690 [Myxococcaceae bacterium]|nr:hypothetical protein [Myxococcaceae bacterium]
MPSSFVTALADAPGFRHWLVPRLLYLGVFATQPACQDAEELTSVVALGHQGAPLSFAGAAGSESQHADGGAPAGCTTSGCACADESPPKSCLPPPIYLADGTKLCAAGTMYCRDEVWTECESLSTYSLQLEPTTGLDAAVQARK